MPRSENPKQTIDEFIFLGHKPRDHTFYGGGTATECSICHCFLGSEYACNPCGDRLGSTMSYHKTVIEEYEFKGKKLIKTITKVYK